MPFSIHNALTNAQMEYNLDHCVNTTVGDEKYQFYCQTQSNLEGNCMKIPSQYLTGGLDCPVMATDAWLDKVYAETGLNCGINCYYYGYGIPPINIPTINIPTFSIPKITYTTDYYSTPTPINTGSAGSGGSSGSSGSSGLPGIIVPGLNSTNTSTSSTTHFPSSASGVIVNSTPTIGTVGAISSAQNISPNMLLLTVLLVSVFALFRRIQ